MRIAVTGSAGLIGTALVRSLRADGHEVCRLVRRPPRGPDEAAWDPKRGYVEESGLTGCAAVVNLAGAGLGDHRWTEAYKKEIRDSRVLGTRTLAAALAALPEPPRVLVNASGVGVYGDTGDRTVDEDSPVAGGFLPSLCVEWEAATAPAREAGVRTVFTRTGPVVAGRGGAWGRRLIPLFRAGLGGRLGTGRQYMSWMSLRDHVAALRFLIDEDGLSGPVNLTGPAPVTNREMTAVLGRLLHRPTVFAVPAPAIRLVLGEFAEDVLTGQRAVPRRLLDAGFRFQDPTVEDALRWALTADRRGD
ncbi:TIGR01777 family oxidoreductase [Streptomyces sp. NPDC101132]|uniref:TIGR01777 family oxidoreductase n=1 Tax=Streptomyces sp. NPDC101132 TaxID=3366110 RepID=UPI0038254FE9